MEIQNYEKWDVATLECDVGNEFWIAANAFKYS